MGTEMATPTKLVNQTFVDKLATTEIVLAQQDEKEKKLQKLDKMARDKMRMARDKMREEKENPARFREAVFDYLYRKFPLATKSKDININSITEKELRRMGICAKRYFGLKASIVPSVAIVSCSLLIWSFVDIATYCNPSPCQDAIRAELVALKMIVAPIGFFFALFLNDNVAPFCDSFRKYFVLKNYLKTFSKLSPEVFTKNPRST